MTDKYIEKNKEAYDKIAENFSNKRENLWQFLKPLKKYVQSGDTVLDIGCGNGRLYQLFDKNQVNFVGIDQSEGLIEIAREKYTDAKFVVSGMQDMLLEDSSVDVIFSIAAFHHLPDEKSRVEALKEMKRVAKEDSHIILTNWNTESDWFQQKVESGEYKQDKENKKHFIVPFDDEDGNILGERHYWSFPKEYMQELAEKAELEVAENKYIDLSGDEVEKSEAMNLLSVFKY